MMVSLHANPLLVVAILAAFVTPPSQAATHAPPPWKNRLVRRSVGADQPAPAAASPLHLSPHLQQGMRHLQQLQQLSRMHLENWAALQQVRPRQQAGDDQLPASKAETGGSTGTPAPVLNSTAPEDPVSEQPPASVPPGGASMNDLGLEVQPPSNCVWAIVTCCQPQTAAVRYSCFELLSCPGAFWDGSPCDPAVTSAALRHASKFYSAGKRGTPAP